MRVLVMAFLSAILGACAPSVRHVALASLDLADGKTLASLQTALPQDDRAALGTYALLHWPKSKFYCGEPIGGHGPLATTVGEAIDQTRAYEAALRSGQASARTMPVFSAKAEDTALVTRMEQLILERDMLRGHVGVTAEATRRNEQIKQQLDEMRIELGRLRNPATP